VIVFVFLPVKEKKKITLVLHQEISSPRFAGLKTGLLKYFSSGETLHVHFYPFNFKAGQGFFHTHQLKIIYLRLFCMCKPEKKFYE